MAGTDFTHRVPGQAAIIGAAEVNAWNGVIRSPGKPESGPVVAPLDTVEINVKNTSGALLKRFEVVGLDQSTFDPADSVDVFVGRVCMNAVTPTAPDYRGRFAVVLDGMVAAATGITAGVGRAIVAGVVPCKVDIVDEAHQCAEIIHNTRTHLGSVFFGSAQILWKETGTGVKWALVRLNSPVIAPRRAIYVTEYHDFYALRLWNGVDADRTTGESVFAWKPGALRQNAALLNLTINSIPAVDAVNVTDGTLSEAWELRPPIRSNYTDTLIVPAEPIDSALCSSSLSADLTAAGIDIEDIKYQDLNIMAREWAVPVS